MECRECGYALWNLSRPECPECGTGFDIRSYRFEPNTVAFACPYCGSQHAGSGENYLPSEADEAVCYGCGRAMRVGAMQVVPLVANASARLAGKVPFDKGGKGNIIARWFRTSMMSLLKPSQLGRAIGSDTSYGRAYVFATLNRFATAAVLLASIALMYGVFQAMPPGAFANGQAQGDALQQLGQAQIAMLFELGMALVVGLFLTVFVAGPAHIILKWATDSTSSFTQSACAVLYGQGPYIIGFLPLCCLQSYIAWVWSIVSVILIFRATHQISGGLATLCILPVIGFILLMRCGLALLSLLA